MRVERNKFNNFIHRFNLRNSPSISGSAGGGGGFDAYIEGTLTTAYGEMSSMRTAAFQNFTDLTSVEFPNLSVVPSNCFSSCYALATASFPVATRIEENAFHYCSALTAVHIPNVEDLSSYAFQECYALTSLSIPKVKSVGEMAFAYCSELTEAMFTDLQGISMYMTFAGCSKLSAVYIATQSVPTIIDPADMYGAFDDSPIASGDGYVYVPESLYSAYLAASGWSSMSSYLSAMAE